MNQSRTKIAAYVRVSKERDGMIAPELYVNQIKHWASFHGYPEDQISWFQDIDFSGRNDERPGFQEMLSRRQEFSLVVVPRLDRFGRSLQNALDNLRLLAESDTAFAALDVPGLDTSTSSGKLIQHIFLALAEFESNRIADGWKAVARRRKGEGHYKSGRPPWGYLWADGNIIPDPEKEGEIREGYRRYVGGESQHAIAAALDWQPRQATRILTKPVYAGLHDVDGELVAGTWEPIIDLETWEKAQARRRARGTRYVGRPIGSGKRLLTGLLFCGRCGASMNGARSGGYTCSNGKTCGNQNLSGTAEQYVIDEFFLKGMEHLRNLAAMKRLSQEQLPTIDLEKRLKGIDRKIANLVRKAADSPGPAFEAAFAKQAKALEDEREEIQTELARAQVQEMDNAMIPLEAEIFVRDEKGWTEADFRNFIESVLGETEYTLTSGPVESKEGIRGTFLQSFPAGSAVGGWMNATVEERRRVIALVIDRVVTTEDPALVPKQKGPGGRLSRWAVIHWKDEQRD